MDEDYDLLERARGDLQTRAVTSGCRPTSTVTTRTTERTLRSVMPRAKATSLTRTRVPLRTLVAYHEAGHAILSSAINDAPRYVSIREDDESLGRSAQKMLSRPTVLAQVYLAGFAAEHLLTGRRPRQLDKEVGFALLTLDAPDLAAAFAGSAGRDGYRAVQAVLRTGLLDDGEICFEIERLYAAARESLAAVWHAVRAVAEALLKHDELDQDGVFEAIRGIDVFRPVLAVQEAHGLRLNMASALRP
jgi:hypothetical protein